MIEIKITSRFQESHRKFIRNNPAKAKATALALKQFVHNPQYPSLKLERLKNSRYWTIRIDKGNRVFFIWAGNSALLVDIGSHDKYRRY
jgi:mRNA-degrading endonuclease RelE of RelBE toxin-antitoxin system